MSIETTTSANSVGVATTSEFERLLGDPGAAAQMVEEAGVDGLPDLLQVATQLSEPLAALALLEAAWQRQPMALPILAAFLQIGTSVPVADMVAWSGRLRVRGWSSLCPLMVAANDASAPTARRLEAAGAAWRTFFDPAARQLIQQMGGDVPADVPTYFTHSRQEVLNQIPVGARRVLDLGCAAGRLGASVKHRQPAEVTGVELDPRAAQLAAEVLDIVHNESASDGILDRIEGSFDAIVAADILEHLPDPWSVVRSLSRLLRPGGTLVVSIPNIANLGVVSAIVNGRFDYQAEGILDRTHLRFFTRATAEELLSGAGLTVESVIALRDQGLPEITIPAGQTTSDLVMGNLALTGVDRTRLEELTAMQFLLTARKRQPLIDERRPEIWDCVAFDGDLDLMDTRLARLCDIVDHVVLVELQLQGSSPCLSDMVSANKHRVKLHHVVVQVTAGMTAEQRQATQREAVLQVVAAAHSGDLLLLCDAAEIVDPGAVDRIVDATASGPVHLQIAGRPHSEAGPRALPAQYPVALRTRDLPAALSDLRGIRPTLPMVENSGWYKTHLAQPEAQQGRRTELDHGEKFQPQTTSASQVRRTLEDPRGRSD